MILNVASPKLRSGLDWAFIAGLVFSLVLAGKIVPFLVVVGVVPVPFLLGIIRQRPLVVSPARIVGPAALYFGYALLTYFFYTGLQPGEAKPVNPDLELYGIALVMLIVGLLRSLEIEGLRRKFDVTVPWALLAAFVVLSVLMFAGYRNGCRLTAAAASPFIPALLFGTLTFLSFLGWRGLSARERNIRLMLNAFAVVVILAYTGSRGIAVAQAGVLLIFAILALVPQCRGAVPGFRQLLVSSLAGVALCAAVSVITGCGSMDRIMPMIKTIGILSAHAEEQPTQAAPAAATPQAPASPVVAQPVAPPPPAAGTDKAIMDTDISIGFRLEMWRTSLHAIAEAPIFGHGALYLQHLITERYGFEHNHNQYLSWLVTGGIVGLCFGLMFLAIPWFVSAGLQFPDRLVVTLAVSIFWGLAMMFDSYFNLKFYTHYYCLLCGLLYALVNDTLVSERHSEGKT
ncbi:O-antigen ligase family protein [Rhizobium sp. C4]|uniref:O-antigen ligase family protein n=1 Tax=Rhizobium sp. C4 TaxID=1349800 RepID=UPI001E64C6C8|nr:O-antigen ligase family protein [Rhizobium sp. C4]MCD2175637.1 O-antigen ligase family protein [Rhizobium sp. C4]